MLFIDKPLLCIQAVELFRIIYKVWFNPVKYFSSPAYLKLQKNLQLFVTDESVSMR